MEPGLIDVKEIVASNSKIHSEMLAVLAGQAFQEVESRIVPSRDFHETTSDHR